ncbi:hypothetical protein DL768_009730 [Monosporascus sp. mg162]|nr:hypothetical protein DL768_009730 [Monosporascus sp. mg162]
MAASQDYGRRLIPHIIDDLAKIDPERIIYSFPKSQDVSKGFRDVTARKLASAIDKVAWWLQKEIGRSSSFETIGYVGPHDLRYVLVTHGCIKAGYQVGNIDQEFDCIEGSLALLDRTSCKYWISPTQQPQNLPEILAQHPMKVLSIQDVEGLLDATDVPYYPYEKTFEEAATEPFCVLHTSGTTGLPKPIFWNHGLLSTLDAVRLLPPVDGDNGLKPWTSMWHEKDRLYSAFPFYHGAGMIMNILMNAFYGMHGIIGPEGVIPNMDLINSMLDHAKIDIWSIVPSLVDELGETPEVLSKFKSAKFICASGGPVTQAPVDKVNEVVRVFNLTGTTEGLFIGNLWVDRQDWIYFSFHPYSGFDFREIESGLYEHYVVRNEHATLFQGLFHTFRDVKEMSLKDLYAKHPTKSNHWIYMGRADEMVVFSNGEKLQPLGAQAIINAHPAIAGSLVIGTGKFQAGLLVELKDREPIDAAEREALIDSIYETVKVANASSPGYAQIHREYIMFSDPEKPFAYTDKGTVKRRATLAGYTQEIENFYEQREAESVAHLTSSIDISSLETVTAGIHEVFSAFFPSLKGSSIQEDLFSAGVDSLIVLRATRALRSVLEKSGADSGNLSPRIVYANPTIEKLSKAVYALLGKSSSGKLSEIDIQQQKMQELRKKYSKAQYGATVILTGSTGSIGSYLLDSLLHQKNVEKIYCLNRSLDGRKKQTESSSFKGLTTDWPAEKVEFLHADLSKPRFGLSREEYAELKEHATHVIHNQWPVNFNWVLTSFEPHIKGVRQLADFCLGSKRSASLFFISTTGTVSHLRADGMVIEAPNHVLTTELSGYNSSKQVSELIIEDAVINSGLHASICRLGQIAGPVRSTKGMWGKQDWLPTIIETSKFLGLLPSTLGSMDRIDWVPVDVLADVVVELAGIDKPEVHSVEKSPSTIQVYHAVNPVDVDWRTLVPTVLRHLGASTRIVSWDDWVDALRRSQHNASLADLKQNPGLKLLDFFESLRVDGDEASRGLVLDVELSTDKSRTFATLEPVNEEWMGLWLKQWGY